MGAISYEIVSGGPGMTEDLNERMARIEERAASIQDGVGRIERRLTNEYVHRSEIEALARRVGSLEKVGYVVGSAVGLAVLGSILRMVIAG